MELVIFTASEVDFFAITQRHTDTEVTNYKTFRYVTTVLRVGDGRRYISLRYAPKDMFPKSSKDH